MNVKRNSLKAWVLAARPKTLTGAAAPVLIGGAMAWRSFGHEAFTEHTAALYAFALCLVFALLMQVDANFINDYYDFKRGTDREDRLGPERACAQGWISARAMAVGIGVVTTLACATGLVVLAMIMMWELVAVGALCVIFSFLYTTRFSYLGLGDLLVIVFFGLVPVGFTYYVMTAGHWSLPLTFAGLAMGLATDNLLMVNNYRDRHQDRVSGKRTIVVRLVEKHGETAGQRMSLDLFLWIGILATILAFASLFLFPHTSIRFPLMFVYLMLHFRCCQDIKRIDGKELNRVLGTTARNIFIFGALMAVSFLWL